MSRLPNVLRQRLPLETQEEVIEYVGLDISTGQWGTQLCERLETLLSCALVCRGWVTKSRIHIFREVRLDTNRKADSFMATITASPRLGDHVRRVVFDLRHEYNHWIYRAHQILPSLLPNIHHLEYHRLPILHPTFFGLSSRFGIITSLELHGLSVKDWTFRDIVRLINGFNNLKILKMQCDWTSPSPFYCHSARQERHPMSLHLDCSDMKDIQVEEMIRWLTKRQQSHPLDEFSLRCARRSTLIPTLGDLFKQCSKTLKTLDFSFDNNIWDEDNPDTNIIWDEDDPDKKPTCELHDSV